MSQHSTPRPRLTVDLAALRQNWHVLEARRPDAGMAAVVKADCYGLGVERIAPALHDAGCRTFFVAYTFEGSALRTLLGERDATICVFNGPADGDIAAYTDDRLTPVLNTLDQPELWLDAGRDECIVHVDTAMNRLGLSADEVETVLADDRFDALPVSHIMSHFAFGATPASPRNARQVKDYVRLADRLAQRWPEARRSLSASAGMFLDIDIDEAITRPGVALYGAGPQDHAEERLATVATLEAPVLQIREIGAGETCGYSGTFTAERPTRLATLGIGYADGYPRSLSNRGIVRLGGTDCPVAGNVSMDLIIVDITDCPGAVGVGDTAECFGPSVEVEGHAARAGTIAYEIFTMLGGRIERVWKD